MVYDTEAIVLRAIRYGEADSVLSLYTMDRGRVSAIAKGARKMSSRLGGRLQPGVRAHVTLHEGRGELATVRGAQLVEPHAGIWVDGYRLRAAACVLESAMRVLGEREANQGAYNLICRTLALLTTARRLPGPPRLDPLVLGAQCKLLIVAGLFPELGVCVTCGGQGPFVGFSASSGGALCAGCASGGEPLPPDVRVALAALVGRPLAEAPEACPPGAGAGVERVVGLVLREHLGVVLRSATPL